MRMRHQMLPFTGELLGLAEAQELPVLPHLLPVEPKIFKGLSTSLSHHHLCEGAQSFVHTPCPPNPNGKLPPSCQPSRWRASRACAPLHSGAVLPAGVKLRSHPKNTTVKASGGLPPELLKENLKHVSMPPLMVGGKEPASLLELRKSFCALPTDLTFLLTARMVQVELPLEPRARRRATHSCRTSATS